MKKNVLLMTLFATAMFAGCEKEDTVKKQFPMTEDGTAYIAVKISSEPGTRGTDQGFEYGSANEHAVTSADFYFYDEAGAYVSQAKVWNGGDPNKEPDKNVEYFGKNVIILKGLTDKTFPKYVVTILNEPSDFTPGTTLREMEEQLIGSIKSGNSFIMTTSSYVHGTNTTANGQPIYFANEVTNENFVNDPSDPTEKPVVIYVERLAAKVNLDVDESILKPVAGQPDTFEIKVSIAGDQNNNNSDIQIGSETVRVRIDGWGLNATAKQTHMVKNIDCSWGEDSANFPWNSWNEAGNSRSLWGKGYAYDKDFDVNGTYGTYLNYNKLSDLNAKIGDDLYCAENTNTAARLAGHMATAPTSVVVAATMLYKQITKGEGDEEIVNWVESDFIRYSGLLFNASDFKAYVLNNLNNLGKLDYWRKTVSETLVSYKQIGVDDIKVVLVTEGNNNKVKLALSDDAKTGDWVKKGAKPEEDTTVDVNRLTSELDGFVGTGYKGGKMYYNIPIEHMYESEDLAEGNYGVVRNHYYKLLINKIEKLGNGVWNPDSEELPIIPDEPEDELYQVGVQIDILSWRVVSQSIVL